MRKGTSAQPTVVAPSSSFSLHSHSHAVEFIDGVAELVLHIADAVFSLVCQPLIDFRDFVAFVRPLSNIV